MVRSRDYPIIRFLIGSLYTLSIAFLLAGLAASFFHLGHPERAWRAASQWRTSWLSREVIALPVVMGLVFLYAVVNGLGLDADLCGWGMPGQLPLTLGALGAAAALALFLCTGMIYAAIKFLQEWATPLTVVNYFLLGTASGFSFAAAYAALHAPDLVQFYAGWAITLTLVALVTRTAALSRKRFALERVHPGHTVAEIVENTGFDFDRAASVPTTPAPEPRVLALIRGRMRDDIAETYPKFAAEL